MNRLIRLKFSTFHVMVSRVCSGRDVAIVDRMCVLMCAFLCVYIRLNAGHS